MPQWTGRDFRCRRYGVRGPALSTAVRAITNEMSTPMTMERNTRAHRTGFGIRSFGANARSSTLSGNGGAQTRCGALSRPACWERLLRPRWQIRGQGHFTGEGVGRVPVAWETKVLRTQPKDATRCAWTSGSAAISMAIAIVRWTTAVHKSYPANGTLCGVPFARRRWRSIDAHLQSFLFLNCLSKINQYKWES